MRTGPPDEALSTLYRWRPLVQAWSPTGSLVADDVPVVSGSISWDVSARQVPEQATLVVPRYTVVARDRYDWLPRDLTGHPLATYGQSLSIACVVTSTVSGRVWTTPLARVRIQSWAEDEAGAVQVEAVGVLQLAADDEIYLPITPAQGSTLLAEFRRVLPAALRLTVDPAVTDRPVAAGTQWAGSRLDVLYEIADALPARLRTDATGRVRLLPPLPELPRHPVARYRDGEARAKVVDPAGAEHDMPTLVSAPRSSSRDEVVNSVTVLSQYEAADGSTASVTIEQNVGPFAVYTYGRKNESWSSDQVTSAAQAEAAGRERLATGLRPARTVDVDVAPDPRVEPDDVVEVLRDGAASVGYVLGQQIDLVAADATRLTVSSGDRVGPRKTPRPLLVEGV